MANRNITLNTLKIHYLVRICLYELETPVLGTSLLNNTCCKNCYINIEDRNTYTLITADTVNVIETSFPLLNDI